MSRPRPDLSNSKKDIDSFCEWVLDTFPLVSAIYVTGSRSSKSSYPPKETSDWDLVIGLSKPNYKISLPSLRDQKGLHADVIQVFEDKIPRLPKAELYMERN